MVCYVKARAPHCPRLTRTNYDHLNGFLRSCNWEKISSTDNEEAYGLFKSHITKGLEECSTERQVHVRKNIYMNRAAMRLRKQKRVLWSGYCETHDILAHAQFRRCRNKLGGVTRKLRKDHETRLAADITRNPKAFWHYDNSRLCTRCRVEDLLDEHGELISNEQEKTGVLSRYFSSVYAEEGAEVPPTINCNSQGSPLTDDDVSSPQKVEAKLASLKVTSSPGPNAIHPRVLHEAAGALSMPLSLLYRRSLDSGQLPVEWKIGHVIPIHKKGDRRNPANYRPVSLTAVPSKVLESIIRDQLLQHFTENGLLDLAQHGFLSKR